MSDKFDQYFDEYMAKKKARENKILPTHTPIDELPLWMDVQKSENYLDCIICRKEFDGKDIVEKCILCHRYFHYEELRKWVNTSSICPSCKNEG